MLGQQLLTGMETENTAGFNIVIVAVDVCMRVVFHIVLDTPCVGVARQHINRSPNSAVPPFAARDSVV